MDSQKQKMTRKDFITLTLTLVGGGAVAAGCSSSTSNAGGGTGGHGSGGTGAGTGGGTGGGSAAGGHPGADAAPEAQADTGGDTGIACADPLPTMQVADATAHTHDLIILAETLSATTAQTLQTGGYPPGSGGHFHMIMLSLADLATLRGGGMVMVTSTVDGLPAHSHMFKISCR